MGPNTCAILYDDDGCEGWELPIKEGYQKLGFWKKNDAEAVVVKRGCTFIGYNHHSNNPRGR